MGEYVVLGREWHATSEDQISVRRLPPVCVCAVGSLQAVRWYASLTWALASPVFAGLPRHLLCRVWDVESRETSAFLATLDPDHGMMVERVGRVEFDDPLWSAGTTSTEWVHRLSGESPG